MKCALVTGGSRGIGKAICLKLASMGYHILINFKSNKEAAENTLKEVTSLGVSAELLKFDVAEREDVQNKMDQWLEDNKDKVLEVLVNNAGIRKDQLMIWMKDEEWDDVLDTNLSSFFFVTRSVLKQMIRKRYGRIINIVSLSGVKGVAGQVNYSAAKAGVIGSTKALAQELGKRKITVNAVAPGFVTTDMTEDIDEDLYKSLIPMKRFGTAEEVADLVGFLASENSSYITGEVININGGLYT